jgi:DNA-binding XRE family transcriptional regulator
MTNDNNMTGAELQTMRDACHLSRDDLAGLVRVQARTVKHWENGRSGVPADVALAVVSLNGLIEAAAQVEQVRAWRAWQRKPGAQGLVLVRYREDKDAGRMDSVLTGYPVAVHGAVVQRVIAGLKNHQDDAHDLDVRVVWFGAADYGTWLAQVGAQDTPDALDHWAAQALPAQSLPHRAGQTPC